jgi:uncharacterized protein
MSVAPTEPQPQPSQQSDPAAGPPRRDLRWVFVGRDGIRAGWSVLIFAAIVVALALTIMVVVKRFFPLPPGPPSAGLLMVNELVQLVVVLIATAIMGRIEGRSVLDYGLRDQRWLPRLGIGAFWGFVLISALVGLLVVTGHLAFDGQLLHGSAIVLDALLLGLGFLLVGLFEENLLRGYLQQTLARGIGFWPAAVLLSIAFGLGHGSNPGEAVIGLVSAGTFGLVACYALYRTGSLWWPIGAHAAWDWGQSYFYGVPDSGLMVPGHLMATHPIGVYWLSGGSVGPEGSIFVILVMGAIVPIVAFTTPARGTTPPPLSPQSRFAPPTA